jgi:hypothetical protein
MTNTTGTVLYFDSTLENFEDCKGLAVDSPFDREERFISAGLGGNKEREVLWGPGKSYMN